MKSMKSRKSLQEEEEEDGTRIELKALASSKAVVLEDVSMDSVSYNGEL